MVSAKTILWSCTALVPLLGLAAWYGTPSGCCGLGCCEAEASFLTTARSEAKVPADCCADGPCRPECCTPECCSPGGCCPVSIPAVKASVKFICPITGEELPCPSCCPLNELK